MNLPDTMRTQLGGNNGLKRYFTIGEVAEMFDVSKSLIRFWENEFDHLKPHKNSKGDRRFTKQNIEQIRLIFHLVKQRGFTLDGAKKEIIQQRSRNKQRKEIIERLESIKNFLSDLKENNKA